MRGKTRIFSEADLYIAENIVFPVDVKAVKRA
jgi:hypothetical protein